MDGEVSALVFRWTQPTAVPQAFKFMTRDSPFAGALIFHRFDSSLVTPLLSDGEIGLAKNLRYFVGAVPLLLRLLIKQEGVNLGDPFLKGSQSLTERNESLEQEIICIHEFDPPFSTHVNPLNMAH